MPQPKNRRTLSREKIIDRALKLADEVGIDGLSMRKLASELGTTPMAIYNHVSNKDELIDLLLARVVGELELPEIGAPWQEAMRKRAHSMRNIILRHKWAAVLLISKISLTDEVLSDVNATIGCLIQTGFSYAQADWARNTIDSHIYGYTLQELNMPVSPAQYKDAASQYLPMVDKEKYPFMHQGAVQVIDGTYDGVIDFSFGLELILSGLEKWHKSDI